MVLSGAATDAMTYDWNSYFSKEQMIELEQRGCITVRRNDGLRKEIIIDKQMLLDFEKVNQRELLAQVTCPVLLIHGNNPEDEEELLLLERSTRALQYLSSESTLEIVNGAKHGFRKQWDTIIDLSNTWYLNHFCSSSPLNVLDIALS